MPIPLLPQFASVQAIGASPLSILGRAAITVTSDNFTETVSFLKSGSELAVYADVKALDLNAIYDILDAGASVIFVSEEQYELLKEISPSRIAVVGQAVVTEEVAKGRTGSLSEPNSTFITFSGTPSLEALEALVSRGGTPVLPAEVLTTETEKEGSLSVGKIITATVKTDRPDGLYTTLVVDEHGVALGLVYSSKESIWETVKTGTGVYFSRHRGLWYKGLTSGDTQDVLKIDLDCDGDCLRYIVRQNGTGFCHLKTFTCFGTNGGGLAALERVLVQRKTDAPAGSYTARLFNDEKLLRAKIMEEAEELCTAKTKEEVAFEAADVLYFALTRCVAAGVSLADVERNLDAKSLKVKRRKGDAKGKWAEKEGIKVEEKPAVPVAPAPAPVISSERIEMRRYNASQHSKAEVEELLRRPAQKNINIMSIVNPIIDSVKTKGDAALIELAAKFDRASLKTPVLNAPFPPELMNISEETKAAIDLSFENIKKFHSAQSDGARLTVETMPGVVCSRFVRPIERVGLYVPGGTAVLPSTALMLGVPAMVAGCKTLVIASPPRSDGSITPEVVYVAHRVGAQHILLAGGAQAVAALAYGTETCPKVDKILGPGNQFVTAAKMFVSNDTGAGVSIDMPAGPSEVLVIADETANPVFVASDLLSQAEHGADSQVILLTVGLSPAQVKAIEDEVHNQAMALPRVDIVRKSIAHSITLETATIEEAMELSNEYAPEHLILHIKDAEKVEDLVENAGSVFVGEWTPESVGDYSAGVNHSLRKFLRACGFEF